MKPEHKVFFAIPFDSATRAMYERVAQKVRRQFPSVTTVIGASEIGPSPEYSTIASFRAQNRELTAQFVAQIRDADVVVADLTHNNPNVHVELGIALTENKNVLRVTGRSVTELGFDIRNLDIRSYRDEDGLAATVVQYLRMFFRIKRLGLSSKHGKLYRRVATPINLDALVRDGGGVIRRPFDLKPKQLTTYVIRDGAVRATFEIGETDSPADWFGIYFRSSENPLLGSHLVYVRKNGAVELGVYPGPEILEVWRPVGAVAQKRTVTVEFENDRLDVRIGRAEFSSTRLLHQTPGRVWFAAWQAKVTLHKAELISRDTLDWR